MPAQNVRIYDGDGDSLMQKEHKDLGERLILVPDALPSKTPDSTRRIRIMWGQHLLEDLLAGRYRSVVCAVNTRDNSHGIISQLAKLMPTSQWDESSITAYARQFAVGNNRVKVLKYDMDMVEVLAVLRPATHDHLTLSDLGTAFRIVKEMIEHNSRRVPSASVSFLGAHANALADKDGREPSFETVLRTMHESGYEGDVYPSPAMWQASRVGLFARYPFSASLDRMREGGF
jgi:hypothetical protein